MTRGSRSIAVGILLVALGAQAQPVPEDRDAGPYVPTPWPIVDDMLRLVDVRPTDVLYDLGSGDGRLVIEAAKRYGARGVGVELQGDLVKTALAGAKREGVADRVRFVQGDLFETDLHDATVVTLYLLPRFATRLVPKLRAELRPGARVVSHDYPLSPWPADKVLTFDLDEKEFISGTTRTNLYFYVVPARVSGTWDLTLPRALAPRAPGPDRAGARRPLRHGARRAREPAAARPQGAGGPHPLRAALRAPAPRPARDRVRQDHVGRGALGR